MKIIMVLTILFSGSLYALDYDPAFHLRHRYNGTKESLKGRDLSTAQMMQDPRVGLKNEPYELRKPNPKQPNEKHRE